MGIHTLGDSDSAFESEERAMALEHTLHAAAASGFLDVCVQLLNADPRPMPNEPDAGGRSAIFYAQCCGHRDVVDLLVSHGWTKMPEGNMHVGPGGRQMWWNSGVWGTARPRASIFPSRPTSLESNAATMHTTSPSSQSNAVTVHTTKPRTLQQRPSARVARMIERRTEASRRYRQ